MNAALDERYQRALACAEAAEARCVVAVSSALRRCRCCGAKFMPLDRRQVNCHSVECDRAVRARKMVRWRRHVAARRLEREGKCRSLFCGCGARLQPYVRPTGEVVDWCPACGALTPVQRVAA